MNVFKNYIDGEFVESKSGKTLPNVNPANTEETVGLFQSSNAEDVDQACSAAASVRAAWADLPATKRGEYLFKAAELLEGRLEQTGEEMTREEGKTLPEAIGETKRAIQFYEQALLIDREIGDRRGEGTDLWNMSLALDQLGKRAQAIQHAEQALTIREAIEDPRAAKVREKLTEWRNESGQK